MKKVLAAMLGLTLVFSAVGCRAEQTALANGIYFAIEEEFSATGWKDFVIVTVEDGMIVNYNWDSIQRNLRVEEDEITTKKLLQDEYGMRPVSPISAEWFEQAEAFEDFVLENGAAAVTFKDDAGHVDNIAGCTMQAKGALALIDKALAAGPVEFGPYEDGVYFAEAADFSTSGWKDMVKVVVMFGNIVSVDWDAVSNEETPRYKKAIQDEYNMRPASPIGAEWFEQALAFQNFVVANNGVAAITYGDDAGHVDNIAGCTMQGQAVAMFIKNIVPLK